MKTDYPFKIGDSVCLRHKHWSIPRRVTGVVVTRRRNKRYGSGFKIGVNFVNGATHHMDARWFKPILKSV
jgi:hypothetical protein